MKKTISINIGGVIFHIEEDGYEKLRNYLNSIQRYFSSFADSKEIVSDIEARVAERFLSKQKSESKQVISLADVDELIAAMGTVADFEAIEQAEDLITDPLQAAGAKATPVTEGATYTKSDVPPRTDTFGTEAPKTEWPKTSGPRKLYRDLRRKLLGGVAAGLAHHFSVDPIWVRLAFLITVFGLPAGSGMMNLNMEDELGPISGFMVLVYIAMWVAFPGSSTLEEDTKIKKFYRNPDRKVVGGVAAGVSSYFGVDLGVVRFAWVLSILFFGTGLIVYIVLWVIAPSANTLTEKMEMQGEPITLSNIESNIKQGLNLDEKNGEEHAITKVLLLPFRAIALIIQALGRLLKGLGPVLRVITGVFLVGVSVMGLLGLIIGLAVAFGITKAGAFDELPAPMMMFQEFPGVLVLSGTLAAAVPLVTFLLLGLTLLSNKKLVSSSVWLTLLGLWIVGIIGATIGGITFQRNFAKGGEVVQTSYYAIPTGTPTFDYEYIEDEENVDVDIRIDGYAGPDSIRVEKTLSARGRTREDAERNAEMLEYNVSVNDSLFSFREGPVLSRQSQFRRQRIDVVVNIPYDKPFNMSRDFYYTLSYWDGMHKQMERYNMDDSEMPWNTLLFAIKRDSGLVCTNMPVRFMRTENNNDESDYSFENEYNNSELDLGERGTYIKQFPVENFNKIDIGGAYSIVVRQGAEFSVSADAQEQEDIDDIKVYVENNTLRVKRNAEFNLFQADRKRVGLIVTMPTVESLSLSGANKTLVTGFTGLAKLNVEISGASKSEINVETGELRMSVSGASKATLKGSARNADLDVSGACKVDASQMNIETADVEASGASKIEVGHIPNLDRHASGASKISTP